MKKVLAILLSRFPYPLDKGDKLRAYNQIKYLSKDFKIHLICLSDERVNKEHIHNLEEYCDSITIYKISKWSIARNLLSSLINGRPFQVGYFYNAGLRRKISDQLKQLGPDVLYCQLARMALYASDFLGHKVLDYQDAFSLNYRRIASHATGLRKFFYSVESKRMARFERDIYSMFDYSTIISDTDKQAIGTKLENLHVIKNGIDTTKFKPHKSESKTSDILFVGNLSYLPNVEAVKHLVYKIVPLLIQLHPDIRVTIVGKSNKPEILAINHPNVIIRGWVDDVVVEYQQAKLFVAPLFTGAGLQNKLLEAMSMKLASVSTDIVNHSLSALPGKQIMLANNESEFAEQISYLLKNEQLREEIGENARQFVEVTYNWELETNRLKELLLG